MQQNATNNLLSPSNIHNDQSSEDDSASTGLINYKKFNNGYLMMELISANNISTQPINSYCLVRVRHQHNLSTLSTTINNDSVNNNEDDDDTNTTATCSLTEEEQFQTTPVIKESTNPFWNCFFFFEIDDKISSVIEFEIVEEKTENIIGGSAFQVRYLDSYMKTDLNITLNSIGTINCNVTFIPQTKYGNLLKNCIENKTLFSDTEFPSNQTTSISKKSIDNFCKRKGIQNLKQIQWKRPKEFCKGHHQLTEIFIDHQVDYKNIIQGKLFDNYFFFAITILSYFSPKRIKYLFIPLYSNFGNPYGIYQIKFYWKGFWRNIIIDDFIPFLVDDENTNSKQQVGIPLFTKSKFINELWVVLLQKAYAKLYGTYELLEGTNHTFRECLEHLTGGFTGSIDLTKKTKEEIILQITEMLKLKHLIVISKCHEKEFDLNNLNNNSNLLKENIPYIILDLKKNNNNIELKLINLFLNNEFWLDLNEVLTFFKNIYFCKLFLLDGYSKEICNNLNTLDILNDQENLYFSNYCEWNDLKFRNAGGQLHYKETFCNNPQFLLKIEYPKNEINNLKNIKIQISCQLLENDVKDVKKANPIGCYVIRHLNYPKNGKFELIKLPKKEDIYTHSTFSKLTRDMIEFEITKPPITQPSSVNNNNENTTIIDYFTVIVCRWYPNTDGKFSIQLHSDYKYIDFYPIIDNSKLGYYKYTVTGKWNGKDVCGTHLQTSTFISNPKFHIKTFPTKSTSTLNTNHLHFTIECDSLNAPFFPYIISLNKFKEWTNQTVLFPLEEKDCVLFPNNNGKEYYSKKQSFNCKIEMNREKSVSYLLIVATPLSVVANFTVLLKSENEIVFEPLK
ncbi:hypothetical protein ABK040_009770 [Willaertia magna]